MTTDQPTPVQSRPRRKHWRLRALLAVNALVLGVFVFSRLERPTAERLGPVAVGIYDVFNQAPGTRPALSARGRRLVEDVKALGGDPSVDVVKPGFLGIVGHEEWSNVSFRGRAFDDAALAKLADSHGDRIGGLYLTNTGVTDAGLKSLSQFTMLRHLVIRHVARRVRRGAPKPSPLISDAGMHHLKGLTHLWTLDLTGAPITDAGLAAIDDLPEIMALYLGRTKVTGHGLAQLKSLPRLSTLDLDGSEFTEDGLKALSKASSLEFLSVNQVPLTPDAIPLFLAIPRLEQLNITGCGFLDEEVAALVKKKPKLWLIRQ